MNNIGGLTRGCKLHLKHLVALIAGKFICCGQCWTHFTSCSSARMVARWILNVGGQRYSNQEIHQIPRVATCDYLGKPKCLPWPFWGTKVKRWHLVIYLKVDRIGWYVTTSGTQADLSWLGCDCKQLLIKIGTSRWMSVIDCFSQYPPLQNCFKVCGSASEDDFLWTNLLWVKSLTTRNHDFTVMWVATINLEVLMSVCGPDIQCTCLCLSGQPSGRPS